LRVQAWVIERPGPISTRPLTRVERATPEPQLGEVLVEVRACGVCRTDLHLAEGDLEPKHPQVVLGHEVVGIVRELGPACKRLKVGDRVGIAWLRHTCGVCRWCRRGLENLCVNAAFTGWDADGGYADFTLVDEDFAYQLPADWSDEFAAPLLCAGIIGYRALRMASAPTVGRLGIYGFGASAHLAAQVALREGVRVHVMTRSPAARELALDLGCHTVGDTFDAPPEPLDSAIVFAPAGEVILTALAALDDAGTCVVAGIHMTDIPALDYQRHLFRERTLRSVTANTRQDGQTFLNLAAPKHLEVRQQIYDMKDADRALEDLAADRVNGAAVLVR
jgi:propanol-preferring alcohol dehydrogenase